MCIHTRRCISRGVYYNAKSIVRFPLYFLASMLYICAYICYLDKQSELFPQIIYRHVYFEVRIFRDLGEIER